MGEVHFHHHHGVQGTWDNGGGGWRSDQDAKVGAQGEAGAQRADQGEAQKDGNLMACVGEM